MSYIVVYQREDGSSGVEECADLDLAVVTAERLRNVDSVERPRIFKTEEITYDFKPYYRVEVTTAAAASGDAAPPAPPAPPAPVVETASAADNAAEEAGDHNAETPAEAAAAETAAPEDPAPEDPAPQNIVEKKVAEKKAAAAAEADTVISSYEEDASAEVDESSSRGGLFSDAKAKAEEAVSNASDAAEDIVETDTDPAPPRRGLFGR